MTRFLLVSFLLAVFLSEAMSAASHKRCRRSTTPHKFYGYGAPPQVQLQSPYYGMEGQDPYWNIATGAPPNMFSMGPNSAGIGSPGYGGHMVVSTRPGRTFTTTPPIGPTWDRWGSTLKNN